MKRPPPIEKNDPDDPTSTREHARRMVRHVDEHGEDALDDRQKVMVREARKFLADEQRERAKVRTAKRRKKMTQQARRTNR